MNAGKVILGALTIIGLWPISLTMTKHKNTDSSRAGIF